MRRRRVLAVFIIPILLYCAQFSWVNHFIDADVPRHLQDSHQKTFLSFYILNTSITPSPLESCPWPVFYPEKFAEWLGWGIRLNPPRTCRGSPESGVKARYSKLFEYESEATVVFYPTDHCRLATEQNVRVWGFDDLPASHYGRLNSSAEAFKRFDELKARYVSPPRDKLHIKPKFVNVEALAIGTPQRKEVKGLKNIYLIAVCGNNTELHIRAPNPTLPPPHSSPFAKNVSFRNILHIMIDSVSHNMLRNIGKRTTKYIEDLNNDPMRPSTVYNMYRYISVDCCSPGNQIPTYSGNINGYTEELLRGIPHTESNDWLWNIARQRGFRTFWVTDNCPEGGARDYNIIPAVDSRVVDIPCLGDCRLADTFLGCVEDKTQTEVVLEGVESFWARHQKERKLAFLQFATTHEATSKMLIELDITMEMYLRHLEATGVLNDTIVVLWSDHGSMFGMYPTTRDGGYEKVLPFLYLLVPRGFAEEVPSFGEMLRANSHRVTTPFDHYEVMRRLLYYPDTAPPFSHDPSNPKGLPSITPPVDISSKVVPERDCQALNIPQRFCFCIPWESHPVNGSSQEHIFLQRALEAHARLINKHLDKCETVELDKLISLESQRWRTKSRLADRGKLRWGRSVRVVYSTTSHAQFFFVFDVAKGGQYAVREMGRHDPMKGKCGMGSIEQMCVCKRPIMNVAGNTTTI